MAELKMLAFDLGASNGRAVYGVWKGENLKIKEIHRFENEPVTVRGKLYWDVLRIFYEMKNSMRICMGQGLEFDSIGVSSWGNTIGLFDGNGDLLANPYNYRDGSVSKTEGDFYRKYSRERLFEETLYKPMDIQPTVLWDYLKKKKKWMTENAAYILMISDIFNYFLSGVKASEKTMAATSSMLDMRNENWKESLMKALGIPMGCFPPIVENGTLLGECSKEIAEELHLPNRPKVIAVAGHDTASASGCVDEDILEESAYLSCGTWSCMGCTVEKEIEDIGLVKAGITNDIGLYGSKQLRFNHTGLWILQECRRYWESGEAVRPMTWTELMRQAEAAEPFLAAIDTEAPDFFFPGDMAMKVKEYCRRTGQRIPESKGEICRVVLESLAYRYRYSVECLQHFAGYRFKKLWILGGGAKNELLCRMTANAAGIPVQTGLTEASVMGNFLQQALTMGIAADVKQGREVLYKGIEKKAYMPEETEKWNEHYQYLKARW